MMALRILFGEKALDVWCEKSGGSHKEVWEKQEIRPHPNFTAWTKARDTRQTSKGKTNEINRKKYVMYAVYVLFRSYEAKWFCFLPLSFFLVFSRTHSWNFRLELIWTSSQQFWRVNEEGETCHTKNDMHSSTEIAKQEVCGARTS